jgi:phage-related protein
MERTVIWIGSSKKDLTNFPDEVKREMGYALHLAQNGDKHIHAKPLKGHVGAKTLEVVEDHDGDTYRAVYTIKFEDTLYVLHCFQKKSKTGISTPKPDMGVINDRLKYVEGLQRQTKRKAK